MAGQGLGTATVVQGNALALDMPDGSVDLIVTSPPYFGLRSYQDGGEHYSGQIGAEATPAEFVDALIAATAEMARVLKPSGSIWVNLGDKYAGAPRGPQGGSGQFAESGYGDRIGGRRKIKHSVPNKSLIGVPWRYALRCIDDLGLILRAEVIWSKPNGLPESVKDRVRRSHETWFHFTKEPRYYSGIDEIREPHVALGRVNGSQRQGDAFARGAGDVHRGLSGSPHNPLGKLPGSVWTIATQPLKVPAELGIDHFAAFPMEWPRRIIRGWSPTGVCVECGEGRRPVAGHTEAWSEFRKAHGMGNYANHANDGTQGNRDTYEHGLSGAQIAAFGGKHEIKGYACACPEPTAPTTPAVVLDPFGGTGTTALVAKAWGRHGISNDMSADYCRLAEWRTNDPKQLEKAAALPKPPKAPKPEPEPVDIDGQSSLLDMLGGDAA